jgi:hypothetical protein
MDTSYRATESTRAARATFVGCRKDDVSLKKQLVRCGVMENPSVPGQRTVPGALCPAGTA